MVTLSVPEAHPLTNEKNGIKVFVVLNRDGEVMGVYPTIKRALLYIKEWTEEGGEIEVPYADDEECIQVNLDGHHEYDIRSTHYRM